MKKLAEELKKRQIQSDMQDQEAFWANFNERVENETRALPEVEKALCFPALKLIKIAACFLFVSVIIFIFMMYTKPLQREAGLQLPGSRIEDYEIFTPNNGVMILTDDDSTGTILWVIDKQEKS